MGKPEVVVEGPPSIWPTRRAISEAARKSGERPDRWQTMKLEENGIECQQYVV